MRLKALWSALVLLAWLLPPGAFVLAATPEGFPSGSPGERASVPGSEILKNGNFQVVILPPDQWPGESSSASHNPVFSTSVPLSEWTLSLDRKGTGEDFFSGPVLSGGRVFVASTSGHVESIEAVSGRSLWHTRLEGEVHTPMITSHRILYVVTSSPGVTLDHLLLYTRTRRLIRGGGRERLIAISQRSGRILWSVALPASVLGSPLLEAHTVALASGTGHLLFLSRLDGHVVVDLPVARGSFGWASPLDTPGAIIMAQENPPMIDRVEKSPLENSWRFALSRTLTYDRFLIGTPVLTPTGIAGIFRQKDGGKMVLFMIDSHTGNLLWTVVLDPGSAPPQADVVLIPVCSDGILYVPSPETGEIVAVSPGGGVLWKAKVGKRPETGGTAVGRLLLVPLPSGEVVAVDRKNGQRVGFYQVKGPLGPHPFPVLGSVFFAATRNGVVSGLDVSVFGARAERLFLKPLNDHPAIPADVVSGGPR